VKKAILIFSLVLSLVTANALTMRAAPPSQQGTCIISAPATGSVLRGQVSVQGTAKHPGFTGYQIGYAPEPNPTGEWTFFASGQEQVENGQLGVWNTISLPDGSYKLLVEVFRNDGNKDLCFSGTVSLNNTAPTATFTAVPLPTTANTPTPLPSPTTTSTVLIEQPPTPTPRAKPTYSAVDNPTPTPEMTRFKLPIEISSVRDWSCKGALVTVAIATVAALYFVIRNVVIGGVRKAGQPKNVEGFHRRRPRQY
jgi:hypothetical protein